MTTILETSKSGTVYDENGKIVTGIKVILIENDPGGIITHTTQTDSNGRYELKAESGVRQLKFIPNAHKLKSLTIKKIYDCTDR